MASKPKHTMTEYDDCPRFHERMGQSMKNSYFKYGRACEAYPHKVNAIASLKKRLKLYEETGNADYLVDIGNFAMIEFAFPAHDLYHDEPTDGGEGRKWNSGQACTEARNDGVLF